MGLSTGSGYEHGAYRAYLLCLRDAMLVAHQNDLEAVEEALRRSGMAQAEIDAKKKSDRGFYLRRCRRSETFPLVVYEISSDLVD